MTENSAITQMFARIGKLPLLTKEQEQELFKRIEAGDEKAKDEIVERNLGLVVPVAKRYARNGIPFADLVQEGGVAIVKARDKFDWRLGNKFSTYATWWINQRIGRYVKKHCKNVFVPEHVMNLAIQINKVKRELAQARIEPTQDEIAKGLKAMFKVNAPPEAIKAAEEFCQPETSLHVKVGDDADTEFGDLIEDEEAPNPAERAQAEQASAKLRELLSGLDEDERLVLKLRYGVGARTGERLPDAEIARLFSLTENEVKTAKKRALAALGVNAA